LREGVAWLATINFMREPKNSFGSRISASYHSVPASYLGH
jgi:hypothetical protein